MVSSSVESQERTWAVFVHLAALSGHLIPFGNVVGPLLVWLIKRDESSYLNEHGKEAVNFQLTSMVYGILYLTVALVIVFSSAVHTVGVGALPVFFWWIFIVGALLWLLWMISVIVAAVAAASGRTFHYPLAIRFIA
jgi:uncharacterized Tic20 family protein